MKLFEILPFLDASNGLWIYTTNPETKLSCMGGADFYEMSDRRKKIYLSYEVIEIHSTFPDGGIGINLKAKTRGVK